MNVRKLFVIFVFFLVAGCSGQSGSVAGVEGPARSAQNQTPAQKLIWRARMWVEAGDIAAAVEAAEKKVQARNGYVKERSDDEDIGTSLVVRVPSGELKPLMKDLEDLGEVTDRYVTSENVTEEFIDTEARLKNKRALRDRLRALLSSAKELKDVLAVEKELNEVQTELDAIEAKMKALIANTDEATLSVYFRQKKILGPLGLVFYAAGWVLNKLFYLQD